MLKSVLKSIPPTTVDEAILKAVVDYAREGDKAIAILRDTHMKQQSHCADLQDQIRKLKEENIRLRSLHLKVEEGKTDTKPFQIHPWVGKRVTQRLVPLTERLYGIVVDAVSMGIGVMLTIRLDTGAVATRQNSDDWMLDESDFATSPTPPIRREPCGTVE